MVDPKVLALIHNKHQPVDEVINERECSSLFPAALNRKAYWITGILICLFHAQDKLRDNVVPTHVGSIDVVRPEDQDAFEVGSPVVEDYTLADHLPGGV